MTHEESIAKCEELRKKAEALAKGYNEVSSDAKASELKKKLEEIDEVCSQYHKTKRDDVFNLAKESGDPMVYAAKHLTYGIIGSKFENVGEGDSAVQVLTIVDKVRNIDAMKLDKHCGGIGKDKNWHYAIERLNCLLTYRTCIELGVDATSFNDSYAMSDIAKQHKFASEFVPDGSKKKPKDPVSNGSMLQTLNEIVHAMVGDSYNAKNADVKFLDHAYGKKSKKALTIVASNNKQLIQLMLEICHAAVTGEGYSVESKNLIKK